MKIRSVGAIAMLGLMVAACGKQQHNPPGGNEIDPAVARALEDQIMVDPDLTQQDGRFGARGGDVSTQAALPVTATGAAVTAKPGNLLHAPAPTSVKEGPAPITLGQLAAEQTGKRGGGCDHNVQYGIGWANRLPAAFPLYPDAQVVEAAGKDNAACRLRLANFTSRAPIQTLIDFYYTQAKQNGFTAEHLLADGGHVLAGTREKDGGAYYLLFSTDKNRSISVDMIVNQGR